jgi:hypothetical protein
MQKKNIIRFGLITLLLAGSLLILRSSGRVCESSSCCKENMDQCPKKTNIDRTPGGIIWETLSRQFFSFSPSP